jgi:hypothetical protein
MSDPLIAAFYAGALGAILGATVTGVVAWKVGTKMRRHSYYSTLLKLITDHNWNSLKEKVNAGLLITSVDQGTATICYQHINLLLYAWLHKDVIEKDGSLVGWKRWAKAIVDGAKRPGNEKYGHAYRDILDHGDLCPADFIAWLSAALEFSAERFPVPQVRDARTSEASPCDRSPFSVSPRE